MPIVTQEVMGGNVLGDDLIWGFNPRVQELPKVLWVERVSEYKVKTLYVSPGETPRALDRFSKGP